MLLRRYGPDAVVQLGAPAQYQVFGAGVMLLALPLVPVLLVFGVVHRDPGTLLGSLGFLAAGLLGYRFWSVGLTVTADAIEVRNFFRRERVPIAEVVDVTSKVRPADLSDVFLALPSANVTVGSVRRRGGRDIHSAALTGVAPVSFFNFVQPAQVAARRTQLVRSAWIKEVETEDPGLHERWQRTRPRRSP